MILLCYSRYNLSAKTYLIMHTNYHVQFSIIKYPVIRMILAVIVVDDILESGVMVY